MKTADKKEQAVKVEPIPYDAEFFPQTSPLGFVPSDGTGGGEKATSKKDLPRGFLGILDAIVDESSHRSGSGASEELRGVDRADRSLKSGSASHEWESRAASRTRTRDESKDESKGIAGGGGEDLTGASVSSLSSSSGLLLCRRKDGGVYEAFHGVNTVGRTLYFEAGRNPLCKRTRFECPNSVEADMQFFVESVLGSTYGGSRKLEELVPFDDSEYDLGDGFDGGGRDLVSKGIIGASDEGLPRSEASSSVRDKKRGRLFTFRKNHPACLPPTIVCADRPLSDLIDTGGQDGGTFDSFDDEGYEPSFDDSGFGGKGKGGKGKGKGKGM